MWKVLLTFPKVLGRVCYLMGHAREHEVNLFT
jgi:hypothetical protein